MTLSAKTIALAAAHPMWLAALAVATAAEGNSFYTVTDGKQAIYKVVYESASTETDLPPGIYRFDSKDELVCIVKGAVLGAGPRRSGIIVQSALSKQTNQFESIAVIDGRLTLFSIGTSTRRPGSKTVIGSKQVPLTDILSHRPVQLAEIQALDDLEIYTQPMMVRHQAGPQELLLISVNQKTTLGSGLTLGIVLQAERRGAKSAASILNNHIAILDYSFHQQQQLSRWTAEERPVSEVFSPLLLESRFRQNLGTHPVIKEWQQGLRHLFELLRKTAAPKAKENEEIRRLTDLAPFYDIVEQKIQLRHDPLWLAASDNLYVIQSFSPATGNSEVLISDTDLREDRQELRTSISGTLDVNEQGKPYIWVASGNEELEGLVLSINGHLVAVFGGDAFELKAAGLGVKPDEFRGETVVAHERFGEDSAECTHVFLISSKGSGSGRNAFKPTTRAFVINVKGKTASLSHSINIGPQFFPALQLSARLHRVTGSTDPTVAFDIHTAFRNEAQYHSTPQTKPFLDIIRSTDKKRVEVFKDSLIDRPAFSEDLRYREYDSSLSAEINSGLYYKNKQQGGVLSQQYLDQRDGRDPVRINDIDGYKLLKRGFMLSGKKGTGPLAIDAQSIEHQSNARHHGALEAVLFPMASDPEDKGVTEFDLVMYLQRVGSNVLPAVASVHIKHPFSGLAGAKIVPGKRYRENEGAILVFLRPTKRTVKLENLKTGGIISFKYRIGQSNFGNPPRLELDVTDQPIVVSSKLPGNVDLNTNMVTNTNGDLFWITTPKLDRKHRDLAVVNLTAGTGKPELPNRSGSNGLILRHNEPVLEHGKVESLKYLVSQWLTSSYFDAKYRFPWLGDHFEETWSRITKKEEKVAAVFDEGSDLMEHLDHLSSAGSPINHEVLLVDPTLRQRVLSDMMIRFVSTPNKAFSVGGRNKNVAFYLMPEKSNPQELSRELNLIRNGIGREFERAVLLINLQDLIKIEKEAGSLEADDEPEGNAEEFDNENGPTIDDIARAQEGEESRTVKCRSPLLLASEGRVRNLSRLQSELLNDQQIQMIIVATPAEWAEYRATLSKELQGKVLDSFAVNSGYLTTTWTAWPPSSSLATKPIRELRNALVSPEEHQVFPDVAETLAGLADPTKPATHQILIVPDQLERLIDRLTLSRWASHSRALDGPWNFRNPELALSVIGAVDREEEPLCQEDILESFMAIHGSEKRGVVYGLLRDLQKLGRPVPKVEAHAYIIRDSAKSDQKTHISASFGDEGDWDQDIEDQTETQKIIPPAGINKANPQGPKKKDLGEKLGSDPRSRIPHALWLVASEGRQIKTEDFKGITQDQLTVPTLLVGTERQWHDLLRDADFEARFGLSSHFEIKRLEVPSEELKMSLVRSLFARRNIAQLGYEFKIANKGESGESAREQLIALLVSRSDQYSRQFGGDVTSGFIRTFVELSRSLTDDAALRNRGVVDEFFVENMFARVFPVTLNPRYLPPDDPQHKLVDEKKAAEEFARLGYSSTLDLRLRFARALNASTRPAQQGRQVPGSIFIFGPSSKGKTFIVTTAAKYLGWVPYNFQNPQDENADFVHVFCQNITENPSEGDNINITDLLSHLNNLMALPKGHRATIFFDDLHKASSTAILRQLWTFIQTLLESPNGRIRVRRMRQSKGDEARVVEIPVRNIRLIVSANPPKDKQMIKKYVGEGDAAHSLVDWIVAAVARSDFPVEDSVIMRFGNLLDISEASAEAKGAALIALLRENNSREYPANRFVTLVAPELVNQVVTQSPKSNFREFLGTATQSLLAKPGMDTEAPIYIATPKSMDLVADESLGGSPEMAIEKFVNGARALQPVTMERLDSRLAFVSIVMESFRLQLFRTLIGGLRGHHALASETGRAYYLRPALHAIADHLEQHAHIPLRELQLTEQDFPEFSSADGREYLLELIANEAPAQRYFPVEFERVPRQATLSILRAISGDSEFNSETRSRRDVLAEVTQKHKPLVEGLTQQFFRLRSVRDLPAPDHWFNSLRQYGRPDLFASHGGKLVSGLIDFMGDFNSPMLKENFQAQPSPGPSAYEFTRLYLYALDKALIQMPWPTLTDFLWKVMDFASKDLKYGQRPEFHDFAFVSDVSPLSMYTPEMLEQLLMNDEEFRKERAGKEARFSAGAFAQRCESLFGE